MGINYRLGGFRERTGGTRQPLLRARFWRLSILLIMPLGAAFAEGGSEAERRVTLSQDSLPVIVYLAVDRAAAQPSAEAIEALRTAVLERLREVLSSVEYDAVRVFENFPAVALSASPDVIALLLTMPEVDSIGRDAELMRSENVRPDFN